MWWQNIRKWIAIESIKIGSWEITEEDERGKIWGRSESRSRRIFGCSFLFRSFLIFLFVRGSKIWWRAGVHNDGDRRPLLPFLETWDSGHLFLSILFKWFQKTEEKVFEQLLYEISKAHPLRFWTSVPFLSKRKNSLWRDLILCFERQEGERFPAWTPTPTLARNEMEAPNSHVLECLSHTILENNNLRDSLLWTSGDLNEEDWLPVLRAWGGKHWDTTHQSPDVASRDVGPRRDEQNIKIVRKDFIFLSPASRRKTITGNPSDIMGQAAWGTEVLLELRIEDSGDGRGREGVLRNYLPSGERLIPVGELKWELVPIPTLPLTVSPCVPARVLTDAVVKIIWRIRLLFASATATRAHVPSGEMIEDHEINWERERERERVTGVPIPILPFVVPEELPLPAAAARILVHWLELEEESVLLRRRMMSVLCSK
jgi:hypothetical protein